MLQTSSPVHPSNRPRSVAFAVLWAAVLSAGVTSAVLAQAPLPIAGLATVFPDDASQWDILDYDGERAGELRLRFPGMAGQLGDITQWTFRFDDVDGSVRPKIKGRDDIWEVRVGRDVAVVRTLFPGRYDEWSVESTRAEEVGAPRASRLVYAVRDRRLLEDWGIRGAAAEGDYAVYTTYEGDWREWTVADGTGEEIGNAAVQLALVWLPVYMRLTAF